MFTVLFGRLGERQLHGATVGVVPLAHSALVLLFVRADLLVAADVLWEEGQSQAIDGVRLRLQSRRCEGEKTHLVQRSAARSETLRIVEHAQI